MKRDLPAAEGLTAADRPRWPAIVAVGSGVLVCVGAGLPWLRIGRVDRSAFALARSVQALDLLDGTLARVCVVALFCTPALVGGVLVTVSLGWWRAAATLSGLLTVLGLAGGYVGMRFAPATRPGPAVTLAGGVLGMAAVVALVRKRRQAWTTGAPHRLTAGRHGMTSTHGLL